MSNRFKSKKQPVKKDYSTLKFYITLVIGFSIYLSFDLIFGYFGFLSPVLVLPLFVIFAVAYPFIKNWKRGFKITVDIVFIVLSLLQTILAVAWIIQSPDQAQYGRTLILSYMPVLVYFTGLLVWDIVKSK